MHYAVFWDLCPSRLALGGGLCSEGLCPSRLEQGGGLWEALVTSITPCHLSQKGSPGGHMGLLKLPDILSLALKEAGVSSDTQGTHKMCVMFQVE